MYKLKVKKIRYKVRTKTRDYFKRLLAKSFIDCNKYRKIWYIEDIFGMQE